MKKVLVVMPSYKQKLEWFKESIDSALNQTYQEFELVIVRCSYRGDEEEVKMLKDYECGNVKILTIPARVNIGVNVYIGTVDRPSEYIALLASDDMYAPDFLEKHIKALEDNPDAMWASCWIERFGGEVNDANRYVQIPDQVSLTQQKTANFINGTSVWRRKIWDKHGGYSMDIPPLGFKNRLGYPDWDLWIRLLKEGYKYIVIKEPLFKWRWYSTQATQEGANETHKYLQSIIGENNNVQM